MKRNIPIVGIVLILITEWQSFIWCTIRRASSGQLKEGFHPRNKHRFGYDFDALSKAAPELQPHLLEAKSGHISIDFSKRASVQVLNGAILKYHYGIQHWPVPNSFLCPPVPSRSDYIHNIADLPGVVKTGCEVRGLDIGTGASCIYPLIGVMEYQWDFVGTDIDDQALTCAHDIIRSNSVLHSKIRVRKQSVPSKIFEGILFTEDKFTFSMCNPPFHSSIRKYIEANERKTKNLGIKNGFRGSGARNLQHSKQINMNFGGSTNELCYPGGEVAFIAQMIKESSNPYVHSRIDWFTCLVSKKDSLNTIHRCINAERSIKAFESIESSHGSKKSRIIAWTYR